MDLNPLAKLDEVQPENLDAGPVVVLNLLKFKSPESISTYLTYVKGVLEQCSDSGAELIYAGKLQEQIQGNIGDWDVVILGRYPSRRHCYEMFRSEEYQALSPLREAALDNAILWPSEPILPYKTQTVEFEGGEWLEMLAGR